MSNDISKDTCFIGIDNGKVVVISDTVNNSRAEFADTLVLEVPVAVGREVFGTKIDVNDFLSKYGDPVLVRSNELTIVFKFDDIDKCPEDLKQYIDLINNHNGVAAVVSYEGNMYSDYTIIQKELDELNDQLEDKALDELAVDKLIKQMAEEMHRKVTLFGENPADVLDDLFRINGLFWTKAVAA